MVDFSIQKTLSANDSGETGGHQAGILIPKDKQILSFFPKLDPETKNPRKILDIVDEYGGGWSFHFIHYNNKLFGGTRNEFRLTGMTPFIHRFNLRTGDTIELQWSSKDRILIRILKEKKSKVIKLSSFWKVI